MSEAALRLVVLISGSGTNLQAIIDAINEGHLSAEIACVISNRKAAYGLERARMAGIPTLYFPLKPYKEDGRGRDQYDLDLADCIRPYQPDVVVLAGWMHILSAGFLERVGTTVINLHPALPDTFPGTHAIERAYEAYQRGDIEASGCMIHHVVPEVDAGPVIVQAVVPFHDGDTLEAYETRMHEAEHRIIVEALRHLAESG